MTTPNTDLTRNDVASAFKTQITDVVNALSKWHSGSNPGGANAPLSGSVSSYSPAPLTSSLLASTTVTTSPTAAELVVGDASLAAVNTLLRNTAIVCSRARMVRLMKYYNNTNAGTNSLLYDQTNLAHLNSTYQLSSLAPTLAAGDASASAFDTFITNLQTAVTNHRNTTLTFTEQWCHSSCHSSHSSRGRR